MKKTALILSFLVLATAYGVNGQADDSEDITVTARVLAQLSVAHGSDLEFGDVARDVAKTIAPNVADAGRFDISGEADSEITLDFNTLPTKLDQDGGAAELALSFSATSARHHTANSLENGTLFNPASPDPVNLHSDGNLYVYIGGTVTPTADQVPANYEATITLTVAYTGI